MPDFVSAVVERVVGAGSAATHASNEYYSFPADRVTFATVKRSEGKASALYLTAKNNKLAHVHLHTTTVDVSARSASSSPVAQL